MMYAFETASEAFERAQDEEELRRVGQAVKILARKTGVHRNDRGADGRCGI